MLPPTIKPSADLTPDELHQLNRLRGLIHAHNPEDHIERNHIEKTDPVFYLFKREDEILAFQAFSVFRRKTPFHRWPIPVIYINISYKDPGADRYVKNFAKRSNLHFIKRQLGRFWFLRPFVVAFLTTNPKLFNRTAKSFPTYFPRYDAPTPDTVYDFARDFLTHDLKIADAPLTRNLVVTDPAYANNPVTKDWERLYESADGRRNAFFFETGIVKRVDGEYYVGDRAVLFLGYSSLWRRLQEQLQ